MFVFPKTWRALFSYSLCLEIRVFASLPTKYASSTTRARIFFLNILQDHPFNTYTKFFKTLLFLTPYYAPVGVSIWGSEILVFRKILRMYNMDDLRIEYSTH